MPHTLSMAKARCFFCTLLCPRYQKQWLLSLSRAGPVLWLLTPQGLSFPHIPEPSFRMSSWLCVQKSVSQHGLVSSCVLKTIFSQALDVFPGVSPVFQGSDPTFLLLSAWWLPWLPDSQDSGAHFSEIPPCHCSQASLNFLLSLTSSPPPSRGTAYLGLWKHLLLAKTFHDL